MDMNSVEIRLADGVAEAMEERGVNEDDVRQVIQACTKGRVLGFLGEPTVNVLKVNLMLDGILETP